MHILNDGTRRMQRIVSFHSFYGSVYPRQGALKIECAAEARTREEGNVDVYEQQLNFCKALGFFRVRFYKLGDCHRRIYDEQELVFVKYFDISSNLDNIDKALGCIKLRWSRAPDTNEAWYDLQEVRTIRGSVHVIRGDYGLEKVAPFVCNGDRDWRDRWFYVNRFREDSAEDSYNALDDG